jgi:hypothetical protein
MRNDRRDHVRLSLQVNSFAALGSDYAKVGNIKNISRGGLAFEYIAGESDSWHPFQVDIFMTGHVFHMYDVPCRLIYNIDIYVPHVKNRYAKILTIKRCGIQFEELSEDDQFQLTLFLESYTTWPAKCLRRQTSF